jgi:hypothetical protein
MKKHLNQSLKKHFLLLIITCCFVNITQASTSIKTLDTPFEEWTLLKEISGIQVYYQISNCDKQKNTLDLTNLDEITNDNHQTFKLKFINTTSESKSISFSKTTTINDSDEIETITINPGTTLIESCENTAKLILTQNSGDKYPVSVSDYINSFKLTTNN